jgi:putative nucleotidyltransferase with HDIG domain
MEGEKLRFAAVNIKSINDLLDMMNKYWHELYIHSSNVANLVSKICTFLRFNEAEKETFITGAFLHDLGKLFIGREVIGKPGPLTKEEWVKIKEHPGRGALIAAARGGGISLIEMIRYHHEWWDGGGYVGLKAQQIPFSARIIALADAFDAMTTRRPYREPYKICEALEEVYRGAGSQFDPKLIATLTEGSFWQHTTYSDPIRLKRQINEEKLQLAQLVESYGKLSHPLVCAQSRWLDCLLNMCWQYENNEAISSRR